MKKNLLISFCALACLLCCLIAGCKNYIYEESIALASLPDKLEYFIGEKLDLTGLKVAKVESDGSISECFGYVVQPSGESILENEGKQKVTVYYKKKIIDFTISVKTVENSKLYLKTPPKIAYYVGQKLDLTGLVLEVLKSDGSVEQVTDFTASPEEGTVLQNSNGEKQTVELSYGDLKCSFEVSVYTVNLQEFILKSVPKKNKLFCRRKT